MKIAVIGSCVTRDNFNSKFNPNYRDFFDCVATQYQSSIVALMGRPMEVDLSLIDNLNNYDVNQIKNEFEKGFIDSIIKEQPNYIIMDFFGDAYFGFIKIEEGQYLTYNHNKLPKTTYFKNLSQTQKTPYKITENRDYYWSVWTQAVDDLLKLIKRRLPKCRVIVHKARFTKYYMTKTNEVKHIYYKVNLDEINKLWNEMDEYVIKKHKTEYISIPNHYISFEGHPWGVSGVHYTFDYYNEFLNQLKGIVFSEHSSKWWWKLKA